MRLGIDIDGCLASFSSAFARELTAHTGIKFPVNEPGFPATWNWDLDAGVSIEQSRWVWKNKISQKGSSFWFDLEPLPGARATIVQLDFLVKSGRADVYFLTHRMGDSAKHQTEKWLYEQGMCYPTVLLSGNKVPLINGLDVQAFVDDKPETILDVAQYSLGRPLYGHVYKLRMPYNQSVKESEAVVGVESVREMLTREGLWK